MPHVLLLGKTGAGKSTLGNLLLYGRPKAPKGTAPDRKPGFVVGHNVGSETMTMKTDVKAMDNGLILKVTDTPGIPDTDKQISLNHYDEIINYMINGPSSIDAIVIVIKDGRLHESDYERTKALMRQFNTLPCPKIMVYRSSLHEFADDHDRKAKDEAFVTGTALICDKGQLTNVEPFHLSDMTSRVDALREIICKLPTSNLDSTNLRTYTQIRDHFKDLSDKDTRIKALEREISDLKRRKADKENTADNLKYSMAGTFFFALVCATLGGILAKIESDIKNISGDITTKQREVDAGRVDQDELKKAREEFEELDALSHG